MADEEDGDDDHKDDGEVRLPPTGLARADVSVSAQVRVRVTFKSGLNSADTYHI